MTSNHANDKQRWETVLDAGASCLSLDRLGEPLSPDEQAHVATCPRCAAELRMFEAYEDDTPGEDAAVIREMSIELARRAARVSAGTAPARTAMLAATMLRWAAVLVMGAGAAYAVFGRQPSPVAPAGTDLVYRSGTVELISPAGDVEVLPAEWTWRAVPGAVRYDLRIREVDGSDVWSGSSAQSRLGIPSAVRQILVPGKTVTWDVVALGPDGREVARSSAQRVRLASRAPLGGVR